MMEGESSWKKRNITIILVTCQVTFIVLLAIFGLYTQDADSSYVYSINDTQITQLECNATENAYNLPQYYPSKITSVFSNINIYCEVFSKLQTFFSLSF